MTCHRKLQVPKGRRPHERSSRTCNGRLNDLRRSHSVVEVKAMEGWVKGFCQPWPGAVSGIPRSPPGKGKGMEGALNR
jgi:hypothetical protein